MLCDFMSSWPKSTYNTALLNKVDLVKNLIQKINIPDFVSIRLVPEYQSDFVESDNIHFYRQ